MAATLTRTERDILAVLQSATEPIRGRELLGRATGARFFIGDSATHVRNMRLKGVPIVTTRRGDCPGYSLVGQYVETERPATGVRAAAVVVEPEPLFAALTRAYDAMWLARAQKMAA